MCRLRFIWQGKELADVTRIVFDGVLLTLYDSYGNFVAHSFALSGNPGFQAPSLQNARNTGPIPEGRYTVRAQDIDYRDTIIEDFNWSPGWGNGRVTLIPSEGTNLYGRSGFFLHGSRDGNGYGSAGCIDLSNNDLYILNLLENQGAENIELVVDYSSMRGFLEENQHPLAGISDECFVAGTMISMWPLDPSVKPNAAGLYDHKEVLARVWQKPIEGVRPNDWVVSFDAKGNLKPGRVSRTFENEVRIILDFFGTGVTPGHVYYRADSRKAGKYEALIDILRDDGVIQKADGTRIRAATGLPVSDPRDRFIWAITGDRTPDGRAIVVKEKGRIRLGTRHIGDDGRDVCVADLILAAGDVVTESGMIQAGDYQVPYHWTFSDGLPKPEDYILRRSGTTLEAIFEAAEWEERQPDTRPNLRDLGTAAQSSRATPGATPQNTSPSMRDDEFAASLRPKPGRKQRRAMKAAQRSAAKAGRRVLH